MGVKKSLGREERGARVMRFCSRSKPAEPEVELSELLCDLQCWSSRQSVDFPMALRRAVQVRDSEYLEEHLNLPSC